MRSLAWLIHRQYRRSASVVHPLTYLFWEATLRCNLHCRHCGSDCKKESGVADMPARDFLEVCKQIAGRYNPKKIMIILTGGEPTLRDDLEYIGSELKRMKYSWGMVSNAFELTPERIHQLHLSGMSSATLSLDGPSSYHDAFRGRKGSFDKVMTAIRAYSALDNFVFDVVTTVNLENICLLEELYIILKEGGVKRWRLFSTDPIGRAKGMTKNEMDQKLLIRLMEFIEAKRKDKGMDVTYGCEGYLGVYEKKVRNGIFFCRAGINIASILVNGDISACPNIDRSFVQGNIYRDDFIEVWENKFLKMRNRSWMKSGKCEKCEFFYRCEGNGFHLREANNDNPLRCHFEEIKKNS